MLNIISAISSIVTLVLFVFYFVGRAWNINLKMKEKLEKFDIEYIADAEIDEKENEYNLGGNEQLKIVSDNPINWIKVYNVEYNGETNSFEWSDKELCQHSYLHACEAIYFNIAIPEGIPDIGIKFERSDYIQGSFIVGYDGRFGGMHPVDYMLKNTVKSILYYMLK